MILPAGDTEADLLTSLFGDESDLDLDTLAAMAGATEDGPLDDVQLEALMREHLGLPMLDGQSAVREVESPRASIRPDDQDADDYTDEEWIIVTSMRKLCLDAIGRDTPAKRRDAAIEWLFVRGTEEPKHGISFHLACDMLHARPWVIQALVQHLWCQRGIALAALPFMADPLPEALQSEAILRAWETGLEILVQVWPRPGVPLAHLRADMASTPDDVFDKAMAALGDAGLVGVNLGRVYVQSRPSHLRRSGAGITWSRSFIGE